MHTKSIGEHDGTAILAATALAEEELLRTANNLRERLGEKGDLLDKYLYGTLKAFTDMLNAFDIADAGFNEALSNLRGICRAIKEGREDEAREHPFYATVRAYADARSIPEDSNYYEAFCVGLFRDYSAFVAHRFLEERDACLQDAVRAEGIPELHEALCAEVGITAADIDNLHNLLMRRFIVVSPVSMYLQAMLDQLAMSYIMYDRQSGEYVFQRLLDGRI